MYTDYSQTEKAKTRTFAIDMPILDLLVARLYAFSTATNPHPRIHI